MPSKINYGISNLESWNPLKAKGGGYHCTKISPGCANCFAEKLNMRFGNKIPYDNRPIDFVIDEKTLIKPLSWRKPKTIFACDLCDMFHEAVTTQQQQVIYGQILDAHIHQFLLLTKRPQNIKMPFPFLNNDFPDNVWLGVTVCNQQEADEKIPILLSIPAAHRWVSIEPMLGEIDLRKTAHIGLAERQRKEGLSYSQALLLGFPDWVVIGSESGHNRRPADNEWIRKIVEQCKAAQVPVLVKQIEMGGHFHTGDYQWLSKDISEWPESLRVRQLPEGLK